MANSKLTLVGILKGLVKNMFNSLGIDIRRKGRFQHVFETRLKNSDNDDFIG